MLPILIGKYPKRKEMDTSVFQLNLPENQTDQVDHMPNVHAEEGFHLEATQESQKNILSIAAKVVPQVIFL